MSAKYWLRGLAAASLMASAGLPAEEAWTLLRAVERALASAPEMRAADAQVAARRGELRTAGAFPNPVLELRADRSLGLEDGRGGTDFTQIAITQPLPLGRRRAQVGAATAALKAAEQSRLDRRLALERELAQAFHALQLATERLAAAEERVKFADAFGVPRRTRDGIVRYLSPLERSRLAVLREQAHQDRAYAEGSQAEAAARLRALLALPGDAPLAIERLAPVAEPAPLAELERGLAGHPALAAANLELDAARGGIEVARRQRLADPAVTVFQERDVLGGSRRSYGGVLVGVQVPLWSRGSGAIETAQAEADRREAALAATRRDLHAQLAQTHAHLRHLIEQAERYRADLLGQAARVYDLTRRGFAAGEANVLALVDAHDTYFEARARYHELLAEGWLTAAELRQAAGLSLLAAPGGHP